MGDLPRRRGFHLIFSSTCPLPCRFGGRERRAQFRLPEGRSPDAGHGAACEGADKRSSRPGEITSRGTRRETSTPAQTLKGERRGSLHDVTGATTSTSSGSIQIECLKANLPSSSATRRSSMPSSLKPAIGNTRPRQSSKRAVVFMSFDVAQPDRQLDHSSLVANLLSLEAPFAVFKARAPITLAMLPTTRWAIGQCPGICGGSTRPGWSGGHIDRLAPATCPAPSSPVNPRETSAEPWYRPRRAHREPPCRSP
jgi:hypothetical protein